MDAIDVDGLKRRYARGFEAVRGISFSCARGGVRPAGHVQAFDSNGAGKTSVELLEGLARLSAGGARAPGFDPYEERAAERPRTGVTLQEGGFPSELTVTETTRMWAGCTSDARPVPDVLAEVSAVGAVTA